MNDPAALLEAVARFLSSEVKPAVADPRKSFAVLIAANLVGQTAARLRAGTAGADRERARLAALLPDAPAEATLDELELALARRLRAGDLPAGFWDNALGHVFVSLRDRLRWSNPRFDARPDYE